MTLEHLSASQKEKSQLLSEQEQKEVIKKQKEYQKEREVLFLRMEKRKDLSFLRSLIER